MVLWTPNSTLWLHAEGILDVQDGAGLERGIWWTWESKNKNGCFSNAMFVFGSVTVPVVNPSNILFFIQQGQQLHPEIVSNEGSLASKKCLEKDWRPNPQYYPSTWTLLFVCWCFHSLVGAFRYIIPPPCYHQENRSKLPTHKQSISNGSSKSHTIWWFISQCNSTNDYFIQGLGSFKKNMRNNEKTKIAGKIQNEDIHLSYHGPPTTHETSRFWPPKNQGYLP